MTDLEAENARFKALARSTGICGNRCGCVGIPCRIEAALAQARVDEAAEILTLVERMWPEAGDLLDAIRARHVKPEGAQPRCNLRSPWESPA